jgi:catechol 2,3-dioxygenase-like lactoylglutathione lyase family enzyme
MNCQLQVVTHSVRDIDEAVAFYTGPAGFTLDVELPPRSRLPGRAAHSARLGLLDPAQGGRPCRRAREFLLA